MFVIGYQGTTNATKLSQCKIGNTESLESLTRQHSAFFVAESLERSSSCRLMCGKPDKLLHAAAQPSASVTKSPFGTSYHVARALPKILVKKP